MGIVSFEERLSLAQGEEGCVVPVGYFKKKYTALLEELSPASMMRTSLALSSYPPQQTQQLNSKRSSHHRKHKIKTGSQQLQPHRPTNRDERPIALKR